MFTNMRHESSSAQHSSFFFVVVGNLCFVAMVVASNKCFLWKHLYHTHTAWKRLYIEAAGEWEIVEENQQVSTHHMFSVYFEWCCYFIVCFFFFFFYFYFRILFLFLYLSFFVPALCRCALFFSLRFNTYSRLRWFFLFVFFIRVVDTTASWCQCTFRALFYIRFLFGWFEEEKKKRLSLNIYVILHSHTHLKSDKLSYALRSLLFWKMHFPNDIPKKNYYELLGIGRIPIAIR